MLNGNGNGKLEGLPYLQVIKVSASDMHSSKKEGLLIAASNSNQI